MDPTVVCEDKMNYQMDKLAFEKRQLSPIHEEQAHEEGVESGRELEDVDLTDVLESDHNLEQSSNLDVLQRPAEGASEHASSGDGEIPNQAGSFPWAEIVEEEMEAKAIAELYVQREPEDSIGTRQDNHISDEFSVGDAEMTLLGDTAAMSTLVSASSSPASPHTWDGEHSTPITPQDLEDIRGFATEDISRVATRDSTTEVLCSVSRCLTLLDDQDSQGQQTAKPKLYSIEGQKLQQRKSPERGQLQQRSYCAVDLRLRREECIERGKSEWTHRWAGDQEDNPTWKARVDRRATCISRIATRTTEVFSSDIPTVESAISSAPVGRSLGFLRLSPGSGLSQRMHLIESRSADLISRFNSVPYNFEIRESIKDVHFQLGLCHQQYLYNCLPDLLEPGAQVKYKSCMKFDDDDDPFCRKRVGHASLQDAVKWFEWEGDEHEDRHLWLDCKTWDEMEDFYQEVVERMGEVERELAQSESEAEEYVTSSTGGKRARL